MVKINKKTHITKNGSVKKNPNKIWYIMTIDKPNSKLMTFTQAEKKLLSMEDELFNGNGDKVYSVVRKGEEFEYEFPFSNDDFVDLFIYFYGAKYNEGTMLNNYSTEYHENLKTLAESKKDVDKFAKTYDEADFDY